MANKTRAWRPDDGFYQAIREKAGEGLSDHELVQMMAVQWLGSQSVTLPTNGESQSVTLTEEQEDRVMELMMKALDDLQFAGMEEIRAMREEIETLQHTMKQFHNQNKSLQGKLKALEEASGFI